MKRNKILFWIGLLVAGTVVFSWLRRRLAEADTDRRLRSDGDQARPRQGSVAPGKKASENAPAGEPDDLQEISGIGPTFSRRLQTAGVHTFADLAALSPEEAREKAGAQVWQADTANWVAQAREKAGA